MPLHQVAQLPVEDFLAYEAYAERRMLPLQRIEFLLARIAMLIDAQRLPGEALSLSSYLINPLREQPAQAEPAPPPETTEDEAQAIATALGHQPRRRRPSDPPPTDAAPNP